VVYKVNLINKKIYSVFFYLDISGERLWIELKRIAEGRNAGPVLKVMLEQNTGQHLGMDFPFDLNSSFYFEI
jgi:hypothetical protein